MDRSSSLVRSTFTVVLITATTWNAPAAVAQGAKGQIAVEVVSAENKRPVSGVTVTAISRAGDIRSATTADDGGALIADLATGLYKLTAEGDGLVTGFEPSV